MDPRKVEHILDEAARIYRRMAGDADLKSAIEAAALRMIAALQGDGRVLLCGNGGSAADAQHIAAELSGRFRLERPALDAEALHVNTSYLTAVANDYAYEEVYARAVEARGREGDVLIALSTSGNSENVVRAAKKAREKGLSVVGMSGSFGGKLVDLCDVMIRIPSQDTARVQEGHILVGHALCDLVEQHFYGK